MRGIFFEMTATAACIFLVSPLCPQMNLGVRHGETPPELEK
jgi:hypothetical protein